MRRRMRAPLTLAAAAAIALPLAAVPAQADTSTAEPDPVFAEPDPQAVARAVAAAADSALVTTGPRTMRSSESASSEGVSAPLDEVLADTVAGVPVGVTARVEAPTLDWRGSDGRREVDKSAPAHPQDRFRAASITKTMVATLVLQEVERGTWALDTPLVDVLPAAKAVVPEQYADAVTLESLLSHRSGLPDHLAPMLASRLTDPEDFGEQFAVLGQEYTAADHLAAMTVQEWAFEPGTDALYSNAGYVLLGLALQEATGRDVGDMLELRVFRPAGMRHTDYPTDPGTRGPFLVGSAYTGPYGAGWYDLDHFDPSFFDAAGAVTTTTADLQRFTDALMGGELLDPATVADMATPRSAGHPRVGDYGLGLYRLADPCTPGEWLYGHDGAAMGTLSMTLTSADGEREYTAALAGRDYTVQFPTDLGTTMGRMIAATC